MNIIGGDPVMELNCSVLPNNDNLATAFFLEVEKRERAKPFVGHIVRFDHSGRNCQFYPKDLHGGFANGAAHQVCLDCLIPHVSCFCDGTVKVSYTLCPHHGTAGGHGNAEVL